jgi:hypothetical protein
MSTAVAIELMQLDDGAGQHPSGIYPPLMVDNQLTGEFYGQKQFRPFAQRLSLNPESQDLALVWMLPLGMASVNRMPRELLAAMVHALDQGRIVVLHGDTSLAVESVAVLVVAFAGGGHA